MLKSLVTSVVMVVMIAMMRGPPSSWSVPVVPKRHLNADEEELAKH